MIDEIEIPESFPSPGAVSGKRLVITGGSRGLGALLAHAFSRAGASVALVARTERDLKAVAEALPGPSLVFSGDVTDEDFNEEVADATVSAWGGLDAWVGNAGISPIVAGPRQTDASVWRHILDVNLTGAFLGAKAASRVMGEGGRLIFTSSVLAERPRRGLTAYSASKAGVISLTKSLGKELAQTGIRVNCVTPAAVRTGMFAQMTAQHIDYMLSKIPMNRFGLPAEIARLVAWLCSSDCSFSTGAVFDASGGRATY